VRELHNAVEWISLSCKEDTIRPDHLPPHLRAAGGRAPKERPSLLSLGLSVEEVEKAMLEEALQKAGGNVSEASRLLKVTRNTLRYRMEKYGLK
jgi:two-component system NtrC family response regulator/two-component system response regulator HydG